MIIFFISNLQINWSWSNILIPIYIPSTMLLWNFKSIVAILRALWPSKHLTYPNGYAPSNDRILQFIKYKVSELRKRRVKLFSHSSQQWRNDFESEKCDNSLDGTNKIHTNKGYNWYNNNWWTCIEYDCITTRHKWQQNIYTPLSIDHNNSTLLKTNWSYNLNCKQQCIYSNTVCLNNTYRYAK